MRPDQASVVPEPPAHGAVTPKRRTAPIRAKSRALSVTRVTPASAHDAAIGTSSTKDLGSLPRSGPASPVGVLVEVVLHPSRASQAADSLDQLSAKKYEVERLIDGIGLRAGTQDRDRSIELRLIYGQGFPANAAPVAQRAGSGVRSAHECSVCSVDPYLNLYSRR